jgi:hypothetical protein
MRAADLEMTVHEVAVLQAVKAVNGVPDKLQSCHTATVGGYIVEGHHPSRRCPPPAGGAPARQGTCRAADALRDRPIR